MLRIRNRQEWIEDKRLSKVLCFTLFLLLTWAPFASPETHLQYQNRGNRYEGIKSKPVSGYDNELISAQVDYEEEVRYIPSRFKVKFYLEKSLTDLSNVHLTVRELDYEYYYWLDRVHPHWQSGFNNVFEWSTKDVIQQLDEIKMYDLGVVVRIGKSEPTISEHVAPVIFYHSQFPATIKGYLFTFKTNGNAHLTCSIYKGGEAEPVFAVVFRKQKGGRPFTIRWDSSKAVEGPYKLVVKGYFLDTNDPIYQTVDFYHQPVVKK